MLTVFPSDSWPVQQTFLKHSVHVLLQRAHPAGRRKCEYNNIILKAHVKANDFPI